MNTSMNATKKINESFESGSVAFAIKSIESDRFMNVIACIKLEMQSEPALIDEEE